MRVTCNTHILLFIHIILYLFLQIALAEQHFSVLFLSFLLYNYCFIITVHYLYTSLSVSSAVNMEQHSWHPEFCCFPFSPSSSNSSHFSFRFLCMAYRWGIIVLFLFHFIIIIISSDVNVSTCICSGCCRCRCCCCCCWFVQ